MGGGERVDEEAKGEGGETQSQTRKFRRSSRGGKDHPLGGFHRDRPTESGTLCVGQDKLGWVSGGGGGTYRGLKASSQLAYGLALTQHQHALLLQLVLEPLHL